MAKFGKHYRQLQLEEWKKYYINYKLLKRKIKEIKQKISQSNKGNEPGADGKTPIRPSLLSIPLIPNEEEENAEKLDTLYQIQNGEQLKDFIELLLKEFKKSYSFFIGIEKVLIKKVNTHLYTQTSYSTYSIAELSKEMKSLSLTVYLAKCLNAFINDIMMAMKKILKKFDKKFSNYFGLITSKLILYLLSKKNSELEYLLQFKIIDEVSTIAENNISELKKYFDQNMSDASGNDKKTNEEYINNFLQKYNQTLGYIKDIDELIYFKTQYKDWLDYIKGKKPNKKSYRYLENDIFNPILSASYYRDNLLAKFLSTKDAFKEVEQAQNPISDENKRNINLIFAQSFFYSTLLTCIYPVIYYYTYSKADWKSFNNVLTFLLIGATYLCSFISIILFYYYVSLKRIKTSYLVCYILLFLGSASYILSLTMRQGTFKRRAAFLAVSRSLIGLGSNPMMGRKYITLYAPKYSLPVISKQYLFFNIIGLSIGPLLIALFMYIPGNEKYFFSLNNCVGWYGCIGSLLLFILHLIFFVQPRSGKFCIIKNETSVDVNTSASKFTNPFFDDVEDEQDKEFYKLQKEAQDKKKQGLDQTKSDDINIEANVTNRSNVGVLPANDEDEAKIKENENINKIINEAGDALGENQLAENYYNNVDTERYSNPELFTEQRETIKDLEAKLYECYEQSSFNYINMMPRTIDDIIIKEQNSFGYMNRNLTVMFLLLFFNSILKENNIVYFSYYILFEKYEKVFEKEINDAVGDNQIICVFCAIAYLLQVGSILFIMPFYKVNLLYKKNLIIYLVTSIILMVPLSFAVIAKSLYVYIPLYTLLIAINKAIEITSSCYLVYLIPPQWKYSHITAGALPMYLSTIGQIGGCVLCLTSSQSANSYINHHIISLICAGSYGLIGFYIYKSKNFRVKALSRVMRKRAIE